MNEINVNLINADEENVENNICPFMSKTETGAGNFLLAVRCIKSNCAIWDNKNKKCSLVRNFKLR